MILKYKLFLVIVLLLNFFSFPSQALTRDPQVAENNSKSFALELIKAINLQRARIGLKILLPDELLDTAAAEAIDNIIKTESSPEDFSLGFNFTQNLFLGEVFDRLNLKGRVVQGVLVLGRAEPDYLIKSLLSKPTDRQEILYPGYTRLGLSVVELSDERHLIFILFSMPIVDIVEVPREIFSLVNQVRKKNGLTPLLWSNQAAEAAYVRALELDSKFGHVRPQGLEWETVLNEIEIRFFKAAENLAQGFKDPEAFMSGWMNSPSHRKVILETEYNRLGVGCHVGRSGRFNCAQIFLKQ
ncbi:MAG: CAP domain-containing protein [Deltaproteobacteria bacterium]|jgi:uncharacterized protein YkwD|nr:CAP domain-containing protein [Deltaproteobacteria bacterium]